MRASAGYRGYLVRFFAPMRVLHCTGKSLSERRTTLFGWEKKLCVRLGDFEVFKFFKLFFFSNLKYFVYISLSLLAGYITVYGWDVCFFLFSLFLTQTHTSARSPPPNWYIYDFHGVFIFPIRKKKEKWEEFRMDRNSVFSSARRLLSDSTWHFCDARTPYG